MSVINILSPHVADLIAAGEVVDRPASVVKELLENSIDAKAGHITVEISGGGMTSIRVTDDGIGMSPEDAGVAFCRHATSKLRTGRDLESIATLGFRGEALAAISAVSRVELTTRLRGNAEGVKMSLEAGEIKAMSPCGCPEGTSLTVNDLFYNTPARLKFLKSDRAEGQACALSALRCALGEPSVSIRLIRDGKVDFFSPGDGKPETAVYAILGREIASSMLEAGADDGSVSVSGFVSQPHSAKGSRAHQYFFCNGRHIKSKTLTAALEAAYKNSLLSGRFPMCALYITLDHAAVDVNVHPAKSEVRFSDERRVFDGVYNAALGALNAHNHTADIAISRGTKKLLTPDPKFFKTMSAESFKKSSAGASAASPSAYGQRAIPLKPQPAHTASAPPRDFSLSRPATYESDATDSPGDGIYAPFSGGDSSDAGSAPEFSIIGEAMGMYIIADTGGDLVIIDKHAAHERVLFDALKSRRGRIMSQTLLMPVTISPGAEKADVMLSNAESLSELGFEIEPYGDGSIVLRSVPADTDAADAPEMLEELSEALIRGAGAQSGLNDEVLHTVACKAAIKAGKSSEPEELHALAEAVLSGKARYCPHGRPVAVTLTKKELDKQFNRI